MLVALHWSNCSTFLVIGRKVLRLEYEAYTSMAVKQLHQLCSDIRGKWPVCKIAIIHRTG